MKELVGLGKPTTLDLTGAAVTDNGIAEPQKALPACEVIR